MCNPAEAQGLLSRVIGGSGDNSLVTVGSGDAGETGAVNVGVGGDQTLDVNVGGSDPVAEARVGDKDATLDADIRLLNGNAKARATLNGADGASRVELGLGGSGSAGGSNGGGSDGSGTGAAPGTGSAGPVVVRQGSGSGATTTPACEGVSTGLLANLIESTRLDGSWQAASNVAVERVSVCPETRAWLAASVDRGALVSAVAADPLLSASLARADISTDRVLAVRQEGRSLTIYAY